MRLEDDAIIDGRMGCIEAVNRDINHTKITYKVKFFGLQNCQKTDMLASKDVKHAKGPGL